MISIVSKYQVRLILDVGMSVGRVVTKKKQVVFLSHVDQMNANIDANENSVYNML